MAYPSSTTYFLIRSQKKFSSCESKDESPYASVYNCNGKQSELFHGLIVDSLTRPRLMSL